jgi:hypothetical protein
VKSPAFLSFVIPVRNDAIRLRRCIDSIRANAGAPAYELIVVDNGSEDGSADVALHAGATVLSLPRARVSEARNAGAQRATAPLLAFVDADHLLDPTWASSAMNVFADTRIAGAGAPYTSPTDANWVQRAYAGFRPKVTGQVPTGWLGSGNLVVRREAFLAVAGFDTTLESCEDVDLCNRLVAAGFRLVADERLRSTHLGDPRTLRALFFGELWRGRDNIRVTLRGPITLAALPSLLIPVIDLVCFAVVLGTPWLGGLAGLAAALIFGGLTLLRAVQMFRRQASFRAVAFLQNVAVAAVYDAARALALVVRATHRTRREVAGERAVA